MRRGLLCLKFMNSESDTERVTCSEAQSSGRTRAMKQKKYVPRQSSLDAQATRFLKAHRLQWNGMKKKSKSVRLALGLGRG